MVSGTLNPTGTLPGTVTEISYTPICPASSPAKVTGSETPLSVTVGCTTAAAKGLEGETVPAGTAGESPQSGRVNI